MDKGSIEEWFLTGVVGFCLSFVVFFVATVLYNAAIKVNTGKVDYCYIETYSYPGVPTRQYQLRGHVPWNSDLEITVVPTFDEAVNSAQKISCPLHVK